MPPPIDLRGDRMALLKTPPQAYDVSAMRKLSAMVSDLEQEDHDRLVEMVTAFDDVPITVNGNGTFVDMKAMPSFLLSSIHDFVLSSQKRRAIEREISGQPAGGTYHGMPTVTFPTLQPDARTLLSSADSSAVLSRAMHWAGLAEVGRSVTKMRRNTAPRRMLCQRRSAPECAGGVVQLVEDL
jgi:hypothetical protein